MKCSIWLTFASALLSVAPGSAAPTSPAQQAAPGYQEPFRPQVHFSPQQHWINDPNGLVYFEGEYHLFYQYNPFGDTPGHISWGHAVSTDLLHWHELGTAIPAIGDDLVFTGSVVIDERNTSKLCTGGRACMIAVYTANKGTGKTQLETQDLAVSQDRGRTWTRYSGNPVLDLHMSDFRDPSASWNEQTHDWLMTVALPNEHQVAFYSSPDLKQWIRSSTFGPAGGATGGQWECPDLVEVPSAQPGAPAIWALKVGINPGGLQGGSGEQYFLGSFDGRTFTPSTDPGAHGWSDYGKDSYCAISYNHLPAGETPTLIGWMDNWQYADKLPTAPWRGQMTLPRRLTYVHDADGLALVETPLTEPLRKGSGQALHLAVSSAPLQSSSPVELTLRFEPGGAPQVSLRLYSDKSHWAEVGFDREKKVLFVDRTHADDIALPHYKTRIEAPLASGRPLDLRILLDRSSLEVFAQGGTLAMTNLLLPNATGVRLQLQGGPATKVEGHLWPLQPIWTAQGTR